MSRQFRYRVTAIVLGGLIFGAPLLTNGTASAEQVTDGGSRQVTFEGGGMFGLNCRSEPDVESMVVPADSTVRVVNRTGYSARLQLGGETKGMLPDEESTEVVFRRGTTAVVLKPNCALGDDVSPLLVTAAPSAPATMPDPIPAPSGGDAVTSAAAPSGPGDTSGQAAAGTALPDSAPAGQPSRITPAVGKPGSQGPGTSRTSAVVRTATGAARAATTPGDPARLKIKARTSAGTGPSTVPAFSGMPPGDEKELVRGVPKLDAGPLTTQAQPSALTSPTEAAAAEPVAAMAPIRETGPIGLLGLIAAVCVMGVGAAAIRAIVSQRANRAKMA